MKQKLLLIPLAGGILALLSFFLPWVKFDSSLIPHEIGTAEIITYSGFETNRFFLRSVYIFLAVMSIVAK